MNIAIDRVCNKVAFDALIKLHKVEKIIELLPSTR